MLHDYTGDARRRWLGLFPYTRTVLLSAAMFLVGAIPVGLLVTEFISTGLRLPPVGSVHHAAVTGLLLMMAGFMTFAFTLLLHSAAMRGGSGIERAV
jgi:hypothetical protein